MKAFITALILLICLVILAFTFSHFLITSAEELTAGATRLRETAFADRAATAEQLCKEWESRRFLFSLTISHAEIDRTEDVFARVCGAAKAEGGDEFLIASQELVTALSHIRDLCATDPEMIL